MRSTCIKIFVLADFFKFPAPSLVKAIFLFLPSLQEHILAYLRALSIPTIPSSYFLVLRVLGGFSRFGSPSGSTDFFARSLRSQDDGEWNAIWEETGTVPEKVPQLPEGRAYVRYPSGVTVRPNDTLTSGLVSTILPRTFLHTPELLCNTISTTHVHQAEPLHSSL